MCYVSDLFTASFVIEFSQFINIFTFGDVVFGVVLVKAFLCIEGETSELRFVFFEMFALEELLLPSTPQTFLTKYRGVKESTKVITFVGKYISPYLELPKEIYKLTKYISWGFLLHVCTPT